MNHLKKGPEHVSCRYMDRKHQLDSSQLAIDSDTRAYLKSLSGQVSSKQFYADVRKFFTTAVQYMLKKFPFGDKLLISAAVADPKSRAKTTFSQLTYFLDRYPCLSHGTERDQLEHEFKTYQMSPLPELSQRPDEAWDTIGSMQSPMTNEKCFENLAKVMKGILTIFHSNADCERVFSLVTKNKTQFRPRMSTEVLSALIVRKISMQANQTVCYQEKISDTLLRKAKQATYIANHSSA